MTVFLLLFACSTDPGVDGATVDAPPAATLSPVSQQDELKVLVEMGTATPGECPTHDQCTPEAESCLCDEAGQLVYLRPKADPSTASGPERRFWAWRDGVCTTASIRVDSLTELFELPRDERFVCATHTQVHTLRGAPSVRYVWTFDGDGRPLSTTKYRGESEQAESIETLTYDERGNLLTRSEDGGLGAGGSADGTPDYTQRATFNERNQLLMEETDNDGDGKPDRAKRLAYDGEGHLLSTAYDSYMEHGPCDGEPDYVIRQVWRDGRLVEKQSDYGNDGEIEGRRVFAYDDNGHLSLEWNDEDGDGTWDYLGAYTRDEAGDISSAYMDGRHTLSTTRKLSYDPEQGGLYVKELTMGGNADGTFRRCDYSPACTHDPTFCMGSCTEVEGAAVPELAALQAGPDVP